MSEEDNEFILLSQYDTVNIFKGMKQFVKHNRFDNVRFSDPFFLRFHNLFFRCDSLNNIEDIGYKNNIALKQNIESKKIHPYKIKKFDLLDTNNSSKSFPADYSEHISVTIDRLIDANRKIKPSEINKLIPLFHDKTGQGIENEWGITGFFNTPHQDFDEQHKYKTEWCSDVPMFFLDQEDSNNGLPLVFKDKHEIPRGKEKYTLNDYTRSVKCQILFGYNKTSEPEITEQLETNKYLNSKLESDTDLVIFSSSALEKNYITSSNEDVDTKITVTTNPLEIDKDNFKIYEYMFLAKKDLYFVVKKFSDTPNPERKRKNPFSDTSKHKKLRKFIAGSKSKKYKHKSNKRKKRKLSKKKKHTNRKRKINYKSKKIKKRISHPK